MPFKTLNAVDFADGTVQLIDSTQNKLWKSADRSSARPHRQHLGNLDIVLVPQPSSDPNDPLRWPRWKKMLAFGNICVFTFLTNFAGGGLGAGFANIAAYFHIGLSETSGLLTWFVLVLGLANFFWVPNAIYFGKRPVFLAACSLLFASCIWGALAQTFHSLLAANIVGGFAGAATEALTAATVNDIFFLHERGSKMGYYIVAISWGSNIGPLCGGFLISSVGWRWQKWLSAILVGINLVMVILFVPETRFYRNSTPSTPPSLASTSKSDVLQHGESDQWQWSDDLGQRVPSSSKTFLQELSPWSGINPDANFVNLFLRPFPFIVYPACLFAALSYSISLAPPVVFNIVSSFVFEAPPYGFSAGINGLVNIPGLIGNLLGAIIGGIMTDKYAAHRARRNNGIFEPETRLHLLLIPAVIVTAGLLTVGFGLERKLHWAVIYVGFGCVSVGLTAVANIGMTYVMDSYFAVAAECLLLINGVKNVIAFGFVYAAVPWVQDQGYARCFGGLAGIFVFVLLWAVPLSIWGARIRHHTAANWPLISW